MIKTVNLEISKEKTNMDIKNKGSNSVKKKCVRNFKRKLSKENIKLHKKTSNENQFVLNSESTKKTKSSNDCSFRNQIYSKYGDISEKG